MPADPMIMESTRGQFSTGDETSHATTEAPDITTAAVPANTETDLDTTEREDGDPLDFPNWVNDGHEDHGPMEVPDWVNDSYIEPGAAIHNLDDYRDTPRGADETTYIGRPHHPAEAPELTQDEAIKLAEHELQNYHDPHLKHATEMLKARQNMLVHVVARRNRSFLSRRFGKKAEAQALANYELALSELGGLTAKVLERRGVDNEHIHQYAVLGSIYHRHAFENDLWRQNVGLAEGKKLNRFYTWWANTGNEPLFSEAGFRGPSIKLVINKEGLTGRLKKAAVMAGAGLPVGVGIGVLGAVFGPIVGGAVGGTLARGITKGVASSKIDNASRNTYTLAKQRRKANLNSYDFNTRIRDRQGIMPTASHITEGITENSAKLVSDNRRRLGKSVLIAATVGSVGSVIGSETFAKIK
jgi:hypothetical protein